MTTIPSPEEHQRVLDVIREGEAAHGRTIYAWEAMLEGRPDPVAAGVDLAPITDAEPTFDAQDFIVIARESLLLVRKARTADRTRIAEGLLSDELAAELAAVIEGDLTAHHRHVWRGLEIRNAALTGAAVADGKLTLEVQFALIGAEYELDAHADVVNGDETEHEWCEKWTFWRDPAIDATATDRDHAFRREDEGGWLFAHKGWIVTAITQE